MMGYQGNRRSPCGDWQFGLARRATLHMVGLPAPDGRNHGHLPLCSDISALDLGRNGAARLAKRSDISDSLSPIPVMSTDLAGPYLMGFSTGNAPAALAREFAVMRTSLARNQHAGDIGSLRPNRSVP